MGVSIPGAVVLWVSVLRTTGGSAQSVNRAGPLANRAARSGEGSTKRATRLLDIVIH